jgi:hypothetical protein
MISLAQIPWHTHPITNANAPVVHHAIAQQS